MKFSTETYLRLPWYCLVFFCNIPFEDACLLTFKDNNEICNAVRGSDKRVYDAHALQRWLRQKPYVIPGCYIESVEAFLWRTRKRRSVSNKVQIPSANSAFSRWPLKRVKRRDKIVNAAREVIHFFFVALRQHFLPYFIEVEF